MEGKDKGRKGEGPAWKFVRGLRVPSYTIGLLGNYIVELFWQYNMTDSDTQTLATVRTDPNP